MKGFPPQGDIENYVKLSEPYDIPSYPTYYFQSPSDPPSRDLTQDSGALGFRPRSAEIFL